MRFTFRRRSFSNPSMAGGQRKPRISKDGLAGHNDQWQLSVEKQRRLQCGLRMDGRPDALPTIAASGRRVGLRINPERFQLQKNPVAKPVAKPDATIAALPFSLPCFFCWTSTLLHPAGRTNKKGGVFSALVKSMAGFCLLPPEDQQPQSTEAKEGHARRFRHHNRHRLHSIGGVPKSYFIPLLHADSVGVAASRLKADAIYR